MADFYKFLNPDVLKSNLMLSALYLTAYELLKDSIIDNIRSFFAFEYRNSRPIPGPQYKDEVINLHKDLLQASCLWLQRNDVLIESEVGEVENIREHRNQIAHELPKLLIEKDLNLNINYFLRVIRYRVKVSGLSCRFQRM